MSGLLLLLLSFPLTHARPLSESLPGPPVALLTRNVEFAPSWVSEPDTRGTFRLLYSCLFTLTLCVYTAIHLNVPRRHETGAQWFWRKLKWVVVAIFAPELVLYAAYVQWHVARGMCKALNEHAKRHKFTGNGFVDEEEPPSEQVKAKHQKQRFRKFSLLYGYYVVMGGLVMNVRDLHDDYSRLTVTPEGVLYLAEQGHFLDVSDETIEDKSKSDGFAKIIVMLQVTWMIVQTGSRLATGLPVTIIEGHTLVHVVTALAMYALWFKKPLNISEPTLVDHDAFTDHVALMLVRCTKLGGKAQIGSFRQRPRDIRLPTLVKIMAWMFSVVGLAGWAQEERDKVFGLERLTLRSDDTSESAYLKNYLADAPEYKSEREKNVIQRRGTQTNRNRMEMEPPMVAPETIELLRAPDGFDDASHRTQTSRPSSPGFRRPTPDSAEPPAISVHPTRRFLTYQPAEYEMLLWDESKRIGVISSGEHLSHGIGPVETFNPDFVLAGEGSNTKPFRRKLTIELSPKMVRRWELAGRVIKKSHLGLEDGACYLIDSQPSNLPLLNREGVNSIGNIFWLVVIFFFLCTGYGGVHCLAWNSHFATHIEMIFWRVACIDLVVAGVVYFLLLAFIMANNGENPDGCCTEVVNFGILFVAVGHFVVYIAARVFLVVEAFMSVRHLPVEAYEVVDWAAFIPHL
ncbi:hypothetical protein ACJZ2D_000857 [Fusarium nematophilum]